MSEGTRSSSAPTWYEERLSIDADARQVAEQLLGPEKAVFTEAMSLLEGILSTALGDGVYEPEAKLKMGVVNLGYGLLWSAWTEAAAGRYSAATNHWRSIEEAPQYLKALSISADARDQFARGQLKMKAVKTIIRNALEKEAAGAGENWLAGISYQKQIQGLSHVTRTSTETMLPAISDGNGRRAIVRFGGGFHSELVLRRIAAVLADMALSLLAATVFAFKNIEAVALVWEKEAKPLIERSRQTLRLLAKDIQVEVDP